MVINDEMIELQRPSLPLYDSYILFVEEMRDAGEKIWPGFLPDNDESPIEFIHRLLNAEHKPRPGLVPETTYWAILNNEVVGRISLRHFLNDNLKEFGGHIGYEVRPSQRRKGIATTMLKLLLATPRAQSIGELLLTCAPFNIGSNKTILSNGGVLKETRYVEKWQRDTNYYWIKLPCE